MVTFKSQNSVFYIIGLLIITNLIISCSSNHYSKLSSIEANMRVVASVDETHAPLEGTCYSFFSAIVNSKSYPIEWDEFKPNRIDSKVVEQSLNMVLADLHDSGKRVQPPVMDIRKYRKFWEDERIRFSESFLKKDVAYESQYEVTNKEYVSLSGGTPVYRIFVDNTELYFRPFFEKGIYDTNVARWTYAAFLLNRRLKLQSVPDAEIAIVNGVKGVVSKKADGVFGMDFKMNLDKDSWSDMVAFEFLIGNGDLHDANYMVNQAGEVVAFDHGKAFIPGVPRFDEQPFKAARTLPSRYSQNFIDNIVKLNEDEIRATLRGYLTSLEIDGVILRRRIIIENLKIMNQKLTGIFMPKIKPILLVSEKL